VYRWGRPAGRDELCTTAYSVVLLLGRALARRLGVLGLWFWLRFWLRLQQRALSLFWDLEYGNIAWFRKHMKTLDIYVENIIVYFPPYLFPVHQHDSTLCRPIHRSRFCLPQLSCAFPKAKRRTCGKTTTKPAAMQTSCIHCLYLKTPLAFPTNHNKRTPSLPHVGKQIIRTGKSSDRLRRACPRAASPSAKLLICCHFWRRRESARRAWHNGLTCEGAPVV
jgi:hypothetical protein